MVTSFSADRLWLPVVALGLGCSLIGCVDELATVPLPPSSTLETNPLQKQKYQVVIPKPKLHKTGTSELSLARSDVQAIIDAAAAAGAETHNIVDAQLLQRLPMHHLDGTGSSALKVTFLHKLTEWKNDGSSWQSIKERNETYGLSLDKRGNLIVDARSSWALSNAMATLYQLMVVKKAAVVGSETSMSLTIPGCPHTILDSPAYPYRGILVDTSRSFYPITWLQGLIVHMSEFKLNVLHLHLTDTASWPLEVDGHSELTEYLSYRDINNDKLTYNRTEVRDLVEFGRLRGVSIVPEVDGPAHAPALGGMDHLRLTVAASADFATSDWAVEAPAGTWNMSNTSVTRMLSDVFTQLGADFSTAPYLHVGGDEPRASSLCESLTDASLKSQCLKTCTTKHGGNPSSPCCTPMDSRPKNTGECNGTYWFPDVLNPKIQTYFDQITAKQTARPVQAWSGVSYDLNVTLPKPKGTSAKPVLQLWQFPAPKSSSDEKSSANVCESYDLVQSSATHPQGGSDSAAPVDAGWMYLECGEASNWISMGQNYWCNRASWVSMYSLDLKQSSRPHMNTAACQDAFIGGEIAIWGEVTGVGNTMSLIFPRAAAFAERAWTNPQALTWKDISASGQPPSWYWKAVLEDALARLNRVVANFDLKGVGVSRLQPKFCLDHPEYCSNYTEPILPGPAKPPSQHVASKEFLAI